MLIKILLLIILVGFFISIVGVIFDSLFDIGLIIVGSSVSMIMVSIVVSLVFPTIQAPIQTQNILALNDGIGAEGNYFLFSGYVDEKLEYRYIIDTDKGKNVESCDADNTYIKETTDNKHYIEHYKSEFKYQWMRTWFICLDDSSYDVIYVPKGTITTKYNIDLE